MNCSLQRMTPRCLMLVGAMLFLVGCGEGLGDPSDRAAGGGSPHGSGGGGGSADESGGGGGSADESGGGGGSADGSGGGKANGGGSGGGGKASGGGSGGGKASGGGSGSGGSGGGKATGGGSGGGGSGGGKATGGGSTGGGSAGGGSTGGGSGGGGGASAGCVKGQTKGSEVAVIGESFIAASHGITKQIEKQAKAAGSLGQNDKYVDNSVSGTTLANGQIPGQYTKAVNSSGTIKYVLMDGGGNDCLINNNGDAALAAAKTLFETMAQKKTEKVVYFFYPDPIGGNYSSLKSCLDALRPKMKALCDGLTAPKCYWLDLRTTWNGHNEYTSDGIHPTSAGSIATGDAVWAVMQPPNCVAQ